MYETLPAIGSQLAEGKISMLSIFYNTEEIGFWPLVQG